MGRYISNNIVLSVMMAIYLCTIAFLIYERISLGRLAREAGRMGRTRHTMLKQIRLKYENNCKLNREVINTEQMVEKYLLEKSKGKYIVNTLSWLTLYIGVYAAVYLYYNGVNIRSEKFIIYSAGSILMWMSVVIIRNLFATEYMYRKIVNEVVYYLDNTLRNRINASYRRECKPVMCDEKRPEINVQIGSDEDIPDDINIIRERQWSDNKLIEEVLKEFFAE